MKYLAALCFALLSFSAISQSYLDPPKVDKRIELLSIVFRLAEADEYSGTYFKKYTDRIENHFAPYKTHELINFAKKVRYDNGIGFDAVMGMAIYVDQQMKPLVPFTDEVPDKRWGKKNAEEFVKLLQKFYVDAKCEAFFESNKDLYAEVSKRFLPVYEKLDLKWYSSFYGKAPTEKFTIVNGVGNGGGNYGPSIIYPDKKREVYAIMGTWSVDSTGMAKFAVADYFPTLLHEFNHSFVNSLLDTRKDAFRKSGEHLYETMQAEMQRQAYGNWETVLNEALVRAAVIKYMKDHQFAQAEIDYEINQQMARGFLWMNELVGELEKYEQQRNVYPTLGDYMPKLAEAYVTYAKDIDRNKIAFEAKRPAVVSITEFKNGSTDVSAAVQTITINFDKPLLGKGYSINEGDKGQDTFPEIGKITYSADRKSVVINVKLKSDKDYQFVLTGRSFKSAELIPIKNYEVSFKTAK